MDLLPKSDTQFKTKEYWDRFFLKRKEAFEWYGNYFELATVLHKYCKLKDDILVLGCGNSRLSEDMYDLDYCGLVNIDISEVVINQMTERNKEKRPKMQYIKMDMLKMDFEDEKFNAILDKGALDAIFTTDQDETVIKDVDQMFSEIQRVLKTNGRYICITLVQEHILTRLLSYFCNGWFIRVHYVETISPLPVFAFIFTKTKFSGAESSGFPMILEICFNESDKIQRVQSLTDIENAIKNKQEYSIIKQSIRKFNTENSFSLGLWSSEGHREPRYTWTVVDSPPNRSQNGLYAIFIVPQGRETEHCFKSDEGRRELASSANYQRLVVVTLHRGHCYESIETIKQELSAKAMDFAPEGVTHENQVPFLSVGGDIGVRNLREKGYSDINGDYVVEEVVGEDNNIIRRLVFLDNPTIIQSEACIIPGQIKSNKKNKTKQKTKDTINHYHLMGPHLQGLVAGLAFVDGLFSEGSSKSGLLVGLGGGLLSMFIHEFYPQISFDAIDIDPKMVQVAKTWFDLKEDERLKVTITDGLTFIKTKAEYKQTVYDIIIFDVNNLKETDSGLVGPPVEFLSQEFLFNVKTILHEKGVLVIDFGCQDKDLRSKLLENIQHVFDEVYIVKIQGLVNEIIFAKLSAANNNQESMKTYFLESVKELQKFGKRSKKWDEDTDLCYIMNELAIL